MKLAKRKPNRLETYDYRTAGGYFVTICTREKAHLFWENVGAIIDRPENVPLNHLGQIVDQVIRNIPCRYPAVTVDKYVIMPNHIHVIMIISGRAAGASPRPTIADIVCAYKSLTTRECKKNGFEGILFQTSFYEHIIRGREDYEEIVKYIYENPLRWYYDELYTEE